MKFTKNEFADGSLKDIVVGLIILVFLIWVAWMLWPPLRSGLCGNIPPTSSWKPWYC